MTKRQMAEAGARFRALIDDAMVEADLSVVSLARASGIGRGTWYSWFRGDQAPQRRTLARAVRALSLTVDQLAEPWGDAIGSGQPAEDQDDVVAPILALVGQISALVEELRLARLEQAQWNEGVTEALALLGSRLSEGPTNGHGHETPAGAPR